MMGEPTPPPYAYYTLGDDETATPRARVTKAVTGVILGALVLMSATYAGSRAGSAAPPPAAVAVVSSVVPGETDRVPVSVAVAAATPAPASTPDAKPVQNPDAAIARLPDAPPPPPPKMRKPRQEPMTRVAETEEAVYLVDPYEAAP